MLRDKMTEIQAAHKRPGGTSGLQALKYHTVARHALRASLSSRCVETTVISNTDLQPCMRGFMS